MAVENLPTLQLGFAILTLVLLRHCYRNNLGMSFGINNVPGPKSPSWLKGNFGQIFSPTAWGFHEFLARTYGSTVRISGPFGKASLYTCDSKAMHAILVKEQDVFEDDEGFIKTNQMLFGEGLLGTLGHRHQKQRKMLNPVFSAAHIRDMVPTFFEIAHKLESALKGQVQRSEKQEVDILSWMARTALELVGQAGLGYSFDPLTSGEATHPYTEIINQLMPTVMRMQYWFLIVLPLASRIGSPNFRRFAVNLMALFWNDLRHIRDMIDYMHDIASKIYDSKKQASEKGDEEAVQQLGRGKDLIMKENMKATDEDRLEDHEVIAQAITAFSVDEQWIQLRNPEAQDKLRNEIMEAKRLNGGQDLSYDELVSLPYLDAVCRETLRLYAPVSTAIGRTACQDVIIPLSKPLIGLNGMVMNEITVPKGTNVTVSILNSNRNPDLWGKDADEWKPERWLSPLPATVIDARIPGVYSHLMTFIGGRRSCIGFKFSQLEMKVVISVLVESFKLSPSVHDAEIFWQMNNVTNPIVGKVQLPQLPIVIHLAH
ncbi:hypothetical protein GYMLUDRAFT_247353 [Collybiopsis luxurians FD-317 M1]|uniref:Unplaced genomic scaffold GYMLUscaffold_45, whole genome shotgun sequence n=1 Tax=Collybiopsis luxurians FD-317 M1 TaxID=944289 RepID=A0A0D0B1S8_9AGAR|nr:hypothetical protein GYMLUDRAFT_247353 [Collybiopsis luxurians FD-317 M1]